jgi:hypothetical protein
MWHSRRAGFSERWPTIVLVMIASLIDYGGDGERATEPVVEPPTLSTSPGSF